MSAGYKWKPLERAVLEPPSEALLKAAMEEYKVATKEEAAACLAKEYEGTTHFRNDLYQVEVRSPGEGFIHLNIRRRDGYPGRDWQHFQQIKNELVGPECEAVELYLAESRRVDTTNKYHLFAAMDPKFRFPIGFTRRDVQFDPNGVRGLRQRPPLQTKGGSK